MSDDRARILVVDDVPENVRLLEAVLDAHGYDVVSATNGDAALELASSAGLPVVIHTRAADEDTAAALGLIRQLASSVAISASAERDTSRESQSS